MPTEEQFANRHGELISGLFCIRTPRQHVGAIPRNGGTVKRMRDLQCMREDSLAFSQDIDFSWMYGEIVKRSDAFRRAVANVPRVAPTDCTVLITGESGTGKDLTARAIHRLSYRSPGAFVRVNCAAIPPRLMVSEIFGQQKSGRSSGTQPRPGRFEYAEGGTLFLEGVGNLGPEAQSVLLQVLDEIESSSSRRDHSPGPNARLIVSASHDLRSAVANGTFRDDLFHRLHVFPVELPTLRTMKGDLASIAGVYLRYLALARHLRMPELSSQAVELLESHPWPGNFRELRALLNRFVKLWEMESGFRSDAKSSDAELLEISFLEILSMASDW